MLEPVGARNGHIKAKGCLAEARKKVYPAFPIIFYDFFLFCSNYSNKFSALRIAGVKFNSFTLKPIKQWIDCGVARKWIDQLIDWFWIR